MRPQLAAGSRSRLVGSVATMGAALLGLCCDSAVALPSLCCNSPPCLTFLASTPSGPPSSLRPLASLSYIQSGPAEPLPNATAQPGVKRSKHQPNQSDASYGGLKLGTAGSSAAMMKLLLLLLLHCFSGCPTFGCDFPARLLWCCC